jgi:hemerythrin-like domain-containing protein
MADVFEVLLEDHDEVKAMLARLEYGPRAGTGASATELEARRRLVEDVIIEESKHEAAEQQHFWPAVRELGPEGDRIADEAMGQEHEAEQVLHQLSKLNADDEAFDELLTGFISDARAHIAFEEGHAWPLMRATLTADEAEELGAKIAQAKRVAPTRPHPNTPPSQAARKAAGPLAGAADRLRDAVTGRGKS